MLTFTFSKVLKIEKQTDKLVFRGENSTSKVVMSMIYVYLLYFAIVFLSILSKNIEILAFVLLVGIIVLMFLSVIVILTANSYNPIVYLEFSHKGVFSSKKSEKNIDLYLERADIQKFQIVQTQTSKKTKVFVFVNGLPRAFAYFELTEKVDINDWETLLASYWETWGLQLKNKNTHDDKSELLLEEKPEISEILKTTNVSPTNENISSLSAFAATFLEDDDYFVINTDTALTKTISIFIFVISAFLAFIFTGIFIATIDFYSLIPLAVCLFFVGIAGYGLFIYDAPQQILVNKSKKTILLKYKRKELLIENTNIKSLHFIGQAHRNKSSVNYYVEITLETKDKNIVSIITLSPKLSFGFNENTQNSMYVYGQGILLADKLSDILGVKYDWKDDWKNV